MIVRIVRMYFSNESIDEFLELFNEVKPAIELTKGCKKLLLMKNLDAEFSLITYSVWESNADLEDYRSSKLFKNTWGKTKLLFRKKAEAFSMHEI